MTMWNWFVSRRPNACATGLIVMLHCASGSAQESPGAPSETTKSEAPALRSQPPQSLQGLSKLLGGASAPERESGEGKSTELLPASNHGTSASSPPLRSAVAVPKEPGSKSDPAMLEQEARKLIAVRRRALASLHEKNAHSELSAQRLEHSAWEYALAYVLLPSPTTLLSVARACRKADWDVEALTIYRRIQQEGLMPDRDAEIAEEVRVLRAKLDEEDWEGTSSSTLRDHMDRAKRAFQESRYVPAAHEFALSYALRPLPRLLFNLAQTYRRDHQAAVAYVLYASFLDAEPDSALKKETLGYLSELRSVAFAPPVYRRSWFWGSLITTTSVIALATGGIVAATAIKSPSTLGGTYVLTFGAVH